MEQQVTRQPKQLIGTVTSNKMTKTVVVEVTSFKQHPLYHKRYRWTKKYLSDTGAVEPSLGDTVRIEATKPLSKLKRWVVVEVVTPATREAAKSATKASTAKKAKTAKGKAK